MRPLALAAVLLAALPTGTAAQSPGSDTLVVILERAVEAGVARDAGVRIDRLTVDALAADARAADAEAGLFPEVSAYASPSQRYGLAFDQTTGALSQTTSEALDVGLAASTTVFDGGRARREARAADFRRRAGAAAADRTVQAAAFDVVRLYVDALVADALVAVQAEALEAERAQLDQIDALVDGGRRPGADRYAQEAAVAARELDLATAEAASEQARIALASRIGLPPGVPIRLAEPGAVAVPGGPVGALVERALAVRPDLHSTEAAVSADRAEVSAQRARRYPTVDVVTSVGTGFSSLQSRTALDDGRPVVTDPGRPLTTAAGDPVLLDGSPYVVGREVALEPTPFGPQLLDNRAGRVGVSVRFPIFDDRARDRAVAVATAALDQSQVALEEARRVAELEVRDAATRLALARRRSELAARAAEASASALDVERGRYELGAGTLTDLTAAQVRSVAARAAEVRARYDVVLGAHRLRFAVGTGPGR